MTFLVLGFLNKYASSASRMTQTFSNNEIEYNPEINIYHTSKMAYMSIGEKEDQGLGAFYIYAFKRSQDVKLKNKTKNKLKSN